MAYRFFKYFLIVFASTIAARSAYAMQIIESELEAGNGSSVYWISEDEVLFFGPTRETRIREDSFRKRINRVTTWNVRTKEVKRFGEIDAGLCYDSGNIAYWEVDNLAKRQWTSIGRLGETRRQEGNVKFDPVTCLPLEALPPLPESAKDRSIMRLYPGHGFIDLGPRNEMKNTLIRLVLPGRENPIELPIGRREFFQARVRYFPFKGAYFFEGDYFVADARHPHGGYNVGPWPKGVPRSVWWLYPDGKVEHTVVPYANWMRRELVPTKPGLLALDPTWFTITGESPFDGVYLIDGKGSGKRFLSGVFEANAVSASGCRFAVRRQPEPGTRRPAYWTVTIVDFCREK